MSQPQFPHQQPYSQSYAPQRPPRRRVWPWVLLAVFLVCVLLFGGCMALIGGAAKSIDDQSKQVRSITYEAESDGRSITVSYDTSTPGGVSTSTAGGVRSGWSTDVQQSGFLGPSMTASLDPDFGQATQKSGTVTCRIRTNGKVIKENRATGEFASASCSVTAQEVQSASQ